MHKIILEILSLIKSLIGLKIKKIEREIKIEEKKEKEILTVNEKIAKNNENIINEDVDSIALKMKEYCDMLIKQKSSEEAGKKKKEMKKFFLTLSAALILCGCTTFKKEVIVVEKEDIPVPMQYEGKDGYWISKSRMMMLFEIAERYQQILTNKTNQK